MRCPASYLPLVWYPPYSPDTTKLERLLTQALEQGHRLGIGDLRVLDYLQLCEELKAWRLTKDRLILALEESASSLYPRLLGLEEFGLVVSGFEDEVVHWMLTKQGRALLVDINGGGPIGDRLRPSSLTG